MKVWLARLRAAHKLVEGLVDAWLEKNSSEE